MDLGWVGMTQVSSKEVRTSRWTVSRTSGNIYGSPKDSGRVNYESEIVRGSFNLSLWMTSRTTFPNPLLRAQNLKVIPRSFELDIIASQACLSKLV